MDLPDAGAEDGTIAAVDTLRRAVATGRPLGPKLGRLLLVLTELLQEAGLVEPSGDPASSPSWHASEPAEHPRGTQEIEEGLDAGVTLDTMVGFKLGLAHRRLREAWESRIAELSLSAPQAATLLALSERPGSGIRELSRQTHTDPMNVKRLVDHLEGSGLVTSSTDEVDKRRRVVTVSARGLAVVGRIRAHAVRWQHELGELMGEGRHAELRSLLDRLLLVLPSVTTAEAALWDRRYAADDHVFPGEPDAALVELAGRILPGQAVDLGSGEGRNSIWLAEQGWDVVAVDSSIVGLEHVRAVAAERGLNVHTVPTDVGEYLNQGEAFDLVVMGNMHPSPEERSRWFRSASEAVRPGGHLFVVGHHVDSLGVAGPPDAARLYTEEIVRDGIHGLDILRLERRRRSHLGGPTQIVDVVAWAEKPRD